MDFRNSFIVDHRVGAEGGHQGAVVLERRRDEAMNRVYTRPPRI